VTALLDEHDRLDSFLETPAAPSDPTLAGAGVDSEVPLDFLVSSDDPQALGRIGDYAVTEVIGRGGMGIVLKARDASLDRVVAIKVLAPELASNATARKRFLREAKTAAAVTHQHVVTIHAVGEDRLPYLVMECVSGQSLQDKLDQQGPLELREVLRIAAQVATGLAAAHAHGVIHRDIKPANILLENGIERVRITDFGLARAADDVAMTRTGEVAGTPQYMSPEQAQGQPVDARSDLFSFGSVLYAMCTGRPPFRAETTIDAIRRVCDDTPRPIREINAEVPEWLVEIIDRLLAKRPEDRFQSAQEVAQLLGQHLAHVQDPGSTPFPMLTPPSPRRGEAPRGYPGVRGRASRRWVAAAVVLCAVLATLGVTEATGVTHVAGTVVRIVTGEGTLIIEIDDPTVQVSLDGEELTISGGGVQQVRLRPGQYQFTATKAGRPVKQELVTITRGGEKVVTVSREVIEQATDKPEPTVTKGAFVVLGGEGVREQKFDTLAEAVLGTSDGDTIEIRGNGPFITETITVANRALTIRAGDGYRPILSKDAADGSDLLVASNAPLVIEGLEFRRDTPRDPKIKEPRDEPAIRVFGGTLHVANCRFHLPQRDCIRIDRAVRRCVLTNCEFVGNWCAIAGTLTSGDEWEIDNCVAAGTALISCGPSSPEQSDASIRVARTSVAVEVSVFNFSDLPDRSEPGQPAAELEVSECLLDTWTVIITQHVEPLDLLARRLRWRGRENVYHLTATAVPGDGGFVATVSPTGQDPWQGPRDLASWGEFWGSQMPGSVESHIRYQGGDLATRAAFEPKNITPEDFRLRADSAGYRAGHDNEDLGADVDLVGPGPAYQRWKTSLAYERWIEKTRQ
jgi:hypothetical protein